MCPEKPEPLRHGECKICGASALNVCAHTAECPRCGILLYYPYPIDDSGLVTSEAGKTWDPTSSLAWYCRSAFYNHTNFTNMIRFAMDESHSGKTFDVLDYGGGGGQFALVCKSHFPKANVFITDTSDAALLPQWRPLNQQIPFRRFSDDCQRFDVIFLNDVFEHLSHPTFVLGQLATKLKEGGRIFIDTPKQFWIYAVTRALSGALHKKVLVGTVSTAHLQIWSRRSFRMVVAEAGLRVTKYAEASEYTMPAEYYLQNMGITNPVARWLGHAFHRHAKWLARNKILAVLSRSSG